MILMTEDIHLKILSLSLQYSCYLKLLVLRLNKCRPLLEVLVFSLILLRLNLQSNQEIYQRLLLVDQQIVCDF